MAFKFCKIYRDGCTENSTLHGMHIKGPNPMLNLQLLSLEALGKIVHLQSQLDSPLSKPAQIVETKK